MESSGRRLLFFFSVGAQTETRLGSDVPKTGRQEKGRKARRGRGTGRQAPGTRLPARPHLAGGR